MVVLVQQTMPPENGTGDAAASVIAGAPTAIAPPDESDLLFRGVFENAPVAMAVVGLDGRFKRVNASMCRMIGYAEAELRDFDFQSITHRQELDACLEHSRRLLAGQVPNYRQLKRCFHRDGRLLWVLLSVSLARNEAGEPVHFIWHLQDITETRQKEIFDADQRAVLERIARDKSISDVMGLLAEAVDRQVEGVSASVLLLHAGDVHHFAPSLPAELAAAIRPRVRSIISGLSQRAAAAETVPAMTDLAADPIWRDVAGIAARNGFTTNWAMRIGTGKGVSQGLLSVYCRHVGPPGPGVVEILEAASRLAAITAEHHHTTRQLANLARHDPLTGLPNRILFDDRLEHAMALARRSGRRVALFVLDIDHFKQINDTLGHDAGDNLLQQFARRLRGQLRETDTLARMGGDEFMLILPELHDPEAATAVATKLLRCLEEPFRCGGAQLTVTTSIGIAFSPGDAQDSAALQRRADEQMYLAKRRGRNGYAVSEGPKKG